MQRNVKVWLSKYLNVLFVLKLQFKSVFMGYVDIISKFKPSLLLEADSPDDDLSDLNNDIVSVTVSVKCC